MKEIYKFTVNKLVKKSVEEITDAGKLIKEVEENEPIQIIFKKPNRIESEEADSVYAIEYGESVRKGILTKPLLEKLYQDKGGILSESHQAKYENLLSTLYVSEDEFKRLSLKEDKTDEEKERVIELAVNMTRARTELRSLESYRNGLFQNTAETRAQNKTVLWIMLFLTYFRDGEDLVPFFVGNTDKEKLKDYDKKVESDDEFTLKVIDKMAFFATLWFMGHCNTPEDFDAVQKDNLVEDIAPEVKGETTEIIDKLEKPVWPSGTLQSESGQEKEDTDLI